MAKDVPYFAKVPDPIDQHWECIGCFSSPEEAYAATVKKYPGSDPILCKISKMYVMLQEKLQEV